jgi:hypothetical protein
MEDGKKFDTCMYRSLDEVSRLIKRCSCKGGNYEHKGFYCNKKQVFDINKEFCDACEEYKSK